MSRRFKKSELETLLFTAIHRKRDLLQNMDPESSNPQVKEMRHRVSGEEQAFRDVLDYLQGCPGLMRVAASGRIDAR